MSVHTDEICAAVMKAAEVREDEHYDAHEHNCARVFPIGEAFANADMTAKVELVNFREVPPLFTRVAVGRQLYLDLAKHADSSGTGLLHWNWNRSPILTPMAGRVSIGPYLVERDPELSDETWELRA